MTDKIVVFSTCGSVQEAETIAHLLVERGLAACVNIVSPVRSIYRWEGRIEDSAEWLLIVKSTQSRFDALAETLRGAHSYEVPEILALPVVTGSPAYLDWVAAQTHE